MATLKIEPTLFIFLGSSSSQVGWRLKYLMDQAYGEVPIFHYFWVDTDTALTDDTRQWTKSSYVDRIQLSGFNANEVLESISNWPAIEAWWPKHMNMKPGHITNGAHQVRLVGRLSLFRLFNQNNIDTQGAFYPRLENALNRISQIDARLETLKLKDRGLDIVVRAEKIHVVIIFSSCGGTGSSMAFDLTYLCHNKLKGRAHEITSYVILPSVIDPLLVGKPSQQRKIKANSYAWFLEHNMLVKRSSWKCKYPGGYEIVSNQTPFKNTFIFEIENEAGGRLSEATDIYNMISQAVFMSTANEMAQVEASSADNDVVVEDFHGELRTYSSLASAALIYPKERILDYCTLRMGEEIISNGFLMEPDDKQILVILNGLISNLKLKELVTTLQENRSIELDSLPAIMQSKTASEVRTLVTTQLQEVQKNRNTLGVEIRNDGGKLLADVRAELEKGILGIVFTYGVTVARKVLGVLLAGETASLSIAGLRKRLSNSEAECAEQETQLNETLEALRNMEGDWVSIALHVALKKEWQERLNAKRTDCLEALGAGNRAAIQRVAEQQAEMILNSLPAFVSELDGKLAAIVTTLGEAKAKLDFDSQHVLNRPSKGDMVYELTREAVDKDYILWYYGKAPQSQNTVTAFKEFTRGLSSASLDELAGMKVDQLCTKLKLFSCDQYDDDVLKMSLLQALSDYYGEKAPEKIEDMIDTLLEDCHPFWRYDINKGMDQPEGNSILCVEASRMDLVPDKYQQNAKFILKPSTFIDRIYASRAMHGVPFSLLINIPDWKSSYEELLSGLDPLHILPEFLEGGKYQARRLFAIAKAFGFITKRETYYYLDLKRRYSNSKNRPGKADLLAQGRVNAQEAFIANNLWVESVHTVIQEHVTTIGNREAVKFLQAQTADLDTEIDATPEGDLRTQLENEKAAIEEYERELASVG
jgi:hypothetical protein